MKPRLLCLGLLAALAWPPAPAGATTLGERLRAWAGGTGPAALEEPLPADRAFRLRGEPAADGKAAQLHWSIAEGYYLYRDKLQVAAEGGAFRLLPFTLPAGEREEDASFGSVEVYRGELELLLPLERAGPGPLALQVRYQGCKEGSVCYPPVVKSLAMPLPPDSAGAAAGGAVADAAGALGAGAAAYANGQTRQMTAAPPAAAAAGNGSGAAGGQEASRLWILAVALVTGLGLAFTPCVFPLLPILSGILVAQGGRLHSPARGTMLTAAYVLAMAATYGGIGAAASALSFNVQAAAQAPWFLGAFGLLLALLAWAMLGGWELQLPAAWRDRLDSWGRRESRGGLRGAGAMGVLSALMVGPCTAPPLFAALAFANLYGDPLLGGMALGAMGLGLGMPLLLIGGTAGALLPRAGPWMTVVRKAFGVAMLGLALWFLGQLLPGPLTLFLWAMLLITTAVFLGALDPLPDRGKWPRLGKGLGLGMLFYGAALIVGAAGGNGDLLRPLANFGGGEKAAAEHPGLDFRRVRDVAELDSSLQAAARQGRAVMLDFRADWCVVCRQLERETFTDPRVRDALRQAVLLQVDVTAYDEADRLLLEKFGLLGPPALLFFGDDARERDSYRIYTFLGAEEFVLHVRQALAS
ncbi:MAG: protein-disulfide reductase DsbD [Gammaproteobacteria bacterium]|nr:protein-disulfide reductase DsbD [Gammaproteobacteria bacterium]